MLLKRRSFGRAIISASAQAKRKSTPTPFSRRRVHHRKACGMGSAFIVQSGVPLNLVQRWLGLARMETTAIYAQAIGEEERQIAVRLWTSVSIMEGPAYTNR
jgi:site-specific recombinase XerD